MSDHYAMLEIQQTATGPEITAAYRRLAMIHHPDRNRGNIVEATEQFQKIQLAYEVLCDESSRRQYDARRNTNSSAAGTHAPGTREFWDVDDDGTYYVWSYVSGMFVQIHGRRRQDDAYAQEIYRRQREREEERERDIERQREAARAAMEAQQERERREREAAKKRAAKLAAKQAQQAEAEKMLEVTFEQEAQKQQIRWQLAGAVTKEAKLSNCLHSGFCDKIKQKRKFKCGACGAKRGMIAFECPHCAGHLCQLCVQNFADKRASDQKPKPSNPRPQTPESSRSQAETKSDGCVVPDPQPSDTSGVSVNSATSSNKSKRAARIHQESPKETHMPTRPTAQGKTKTPTKPQSQAERLEDILVEPESASQRPNEKTTVRPEPQPQNVPLDTKPSAHSRKTQDHIAKSVQPNTSSKHEANPTVPTDKKQEEEQASRVAEKRRRDRKPRPHVNESKSSNAKAQISKAETPGGVSVETINENTGGLRHGPKEQTTGENPKPKRCFNCGKPGHFAAACRQPRDAPNSAAPKLCYTCGKPGHFAAACRQSRDESQDWADQW